MKNAPKTGKRGIFIYGKTRRTDSIFICGKGSDPRGPFRKREEPGMIKGNRTQEAEKEGEKT